MEDSSDFAQARLAAIVDSSFDAIVSKDLNSVIQTWNAAAERLFGYTADEAVGQSILMLIPAALHSEETDIIAKIRAGERVESFDTTRVRKDGSSVTVSITVSPIKDDNGRIVGASKIARDISAAKESEQRIRILLREVNHRVKNQFSVILSIIRESSNRARSPSEFEDQVRARIMALSSSHDLLVNSDWSGAGLAELVQEHLNIFGNSEQVSLSGPLLMLNPTAVQNLGMAVHELGTNASKYGALSPAGGHVEIHWQLQGNEDEKKLMLVWDEISASICRPDDDIQARRGFGSVVLERVVPLALSGEARLIRDTGHLTWTLTVPAKEVIASSGQARSADNQDFFFAATHAP